ncbi:MAG: O-antigen ligase family protein [bacterium]|nr:O-antigen ligase family protein [bacterium]MDD5757123.1 O-antigen ligase family protein [bacterium]
MGLGILGFIKGFAPEIIYAGGLFFMISLALRRRVDLALLFLVPLLPLRNVIEKIQMFPVGKDFVDIILIALIVGWIISKNREGKPLFAPTPFNKVLFFMIFYTYILLWLGSFYLHFPTPLNFADERLQTWKNYMVLPLLYFLVVNNISTQKQIKRLVLAMVCGWIIMDYYTGNQISWMPGLVSREKIEGTFTWAGVNAVAAFYAQYVFIFLGLWFTVKDKFWRVICMLIILLGVYIVLFLYSRGAYVALLTGTMAIVLIRKKILIIPLFLLLLSWQSILPPLVVERINQTSTSSGSLDDSSEKRLAVWKESIKLFGKNPVTGVGFNVFPYLGYELGDTHNMFLKILVEQGIFGMFIFLFMFLLALKSGWRLYKNTEDSFLKGLGLGFIACVIATMTTNVFGDRWTYVQLGAYYWVFLALVVRGNIIIEEEPSVVDK